jgi:hypothetical protein
MTLKEFLDMLAETQSHGGVTVKVLHGDQELEPKSATLAHDDDGEKAVVWIAAE